MLIHGPSGIGPTSTWREIERGAGPVRSPGLGYAFRVTWLRCGKAIEGQRPIAAQFAAGSSALAAGRPGLTAGTTQAKMNGSGRAEKCFRRGRAAE